MMKIKRLEIKGFKSIDHLVLENVSPLMVLVGANGTGKSNVADALAFFSHMIKDNLENAVKALGGIENIRPFKLKKSDKAITSLKLKIELKEKNYEYHIEILSTNDSYKIAQEKLKEDAVEIFDRKKFIQEIKRYKSEDIMPSIIAGGISGGIIGALSTPEKERKLANTIVGGISGALLTLLIKSSQFFSSDLALIKQEFIKDNVLKKYIANIKVFRIDPNKAKNSINHKKQDHLKHDGSNIAAVLSAWEHDDDFREQMLEWLQLIVPNMQTVQTESRDLDGAMMLGFQEKGMNKRFPAMLISDGTIYTLCILAAVLSRSREYGITIIEEPERGIHPQAIGELMSLMRESAGNKHMILLTTHSEAVIRNAEISEIYLASKPDGSTRIHSAAASGVDKKQIPLDTAWLSNLFDGGLPW